MNVELIWLGNSGSQPAWALGGVRAIEATPRAVHTLVQQCAATSTADAWLFWDDSFGLPDAQKIERALAMPGDLWHAGLRLGMAGLPELIDYVAPTWMLNRDPHPEMEATSWRLSLRACLVRTDVLRQIGSVYPCFQTLEGAALEMGHRYAMRGVLTRYIPWLVEQQTEAPRFILPFEDELRFSYYRFGTFWSRWALGRALITRRISPQRALRAWKPVTADQRPSQPPPYAHPGKTYTGLKEGFRVTVLIPTLNRYSYLRTLLAQLRSQTVAPLEIIVVDQTPRIRRDISLSEDFKDLPLKLVNQDQLGQCSARNAALRLAAGDYVLFLDDDDEVPPTLIEAHLQNLSAFRAEVSAGVSDEVGAGPLPEHFTYTRASDVFPTNNSLIRREVLTRSGLFDLAYDRGRNEDGDLGIRIYLNGDLMVLNPCISVLHHHAPQGGLRTHKARTITYASSRQNISHRNVLSIWEIYQAMRYFTPRQIREMLWLSALGTFSIRGGIIRKVAKFVVSLVYMPHTLWQIRKGYEQAGQMLKRFPKIPTLTESCVRKGNIPASAWRE